MNRQQQFLTQIGGTVALVALLGAIPAVAAQRLYAGTACQPTIAVAHNTSLIRAPGNRLRNGSNQLDLSDLQAERIAGSYVSARDRRVGLQFVSSKADGKIVLWLADLAGYELVYMEGSKAEGVMLRHGGDLTWRMAPGLVQQSISAKQGEGPPPVLPEPMLSLDGQPSTDSDIVVEGEPARLAEVEKRPELALLPALSRALGDKGLAGHELPATLPLHAYAMKFSSKSPDVLFFCTPGDVECCERNPNDPGCAPEEPNPEPSECADEPVGSGCYGMCGIGCDCWFSVCGDCCYHSGCATHDDWCRACGPEPWNWPYCLLCYSEAALIAIVGC